MLLAIREACSTHHPDSTGIGPEAFAYISDDGGYTGGGGLSSRQRDFYNQHGFYITDSKYILRPEVLESNFYAWRATGDTKYLDNVASAVKSFEEYLQATVAYSGVTNVDNVRSLKDNKMESFWFAEVLKYLYAIFPLSFPGAFPTDPSPLLTAT